LGITEKELKEMEGKRKGKIRKNQQRKGKRKAQGRKNGRMG